MQSLRLAPETKPRSVESIDVGQNTIGGAIRRLAELQPGHAAVVASGFAPLSYWELQKLIDEVRAALRLAGFGRNARIAISMRDGPQAALAIIAVACSAVSIPLNPRQTLTEIESCLGALRLDAMLLVKGADSAARGAAERKSVPVIEAIPKNEGTLGFSIAGPQTSIAAASGEEPNSDASAFILQTSGTSADEPKLVPYSHRNMLVTAAIARIWYNLTPQDRCLSVSPVFYAHGLKVTVFTPLLTGGTVAFPTDAAKFDHSEWFGFLKPTWYSAGPTLNRLISDQTLSNGDAKLSHSLRFITVGLAAAPRDVLEKLQHALSVPVLPCYGASEASVISSNQPPPGRAKVGTVGLPWPNTVIIAGEDGRQLSAGERGEVLVGGATVISGYLNAPELNRTRFVDGWFKTGDIGSIDEEGFLTLHGRKDDLINRGGEKVSPVEIDDALMRHPVVAEAAAFAVPHSRLGQDVAAAVVLRPGMTATPIELRSYLQEQLASFKIPRRIIIRDQLPKGQTGKVVRRQLATLLEEDREAATGNSPSQVSGDRPIDSDLVLKLTEMWERLLKVAPLSPDDDFFESGGDSLLAMDMLAELELLTGRTVPTAILFEASTIRQLAQTLSEDGHLNEKPKTLIRLNSGGSRAPLFLFHDSFNGMGYWAIALARHLGSDQPVLVVAPRGDGKESIPSSIEALAAERLPLIINAQVEGPYRLCGYCVGGLFAFEIARLLVAAGKKVEMVVMLDPPTVSANRSIQLLFSIMRRARPVVGPIADRAMRWMLFTFVALQRFYNVSWTRRWVAIMRRVRSLGTGLVGRSSTERHVVERRNSAALSNYIPRPLGVHVVYFSVDYGPGAWRRISPDLEIIKSSGIHDQLDIADIAKHLRARL